MPKYGIDNFEHEYDEDLILKGEELYDSAAVNEILQIEPNLFTVFVKEGGIYEVEIFKPFTQQKRFHCDCSFFQNHHICKHVIAALFSIRRYQLENKSEKSKNSEVKASTLNVNNILNALNLDELRYFIKQYAQHDKKLSTALKVTFARKIDLIDNEKKYKAILDSIIRPIADLQFKAKTSDVNSLVAVTEDFIDQMEDCLSLGQHLEAFHILKACIAKLSYVKYHTNFCEDEVHLQLLKLHENLRILAVDAPAEDLRSEVVDFMESLINLSYYRFDLYPNNLFLTLNICKRMPAEELLSKISKKIQENGRLEAEVVNLYAIFFELALTSGIQADFKLPTNHIHLLDRIIEHFLNYENFAVGLNFVQEQLKLNPKAVQTRYFELVFFLKMQNIEGFTKSAISYFQLSFDIKILDLLQFHLSEDAYRNHIPELNEATQNHKINVNQLLSYYQKTEQWACLLQTLKEKNDLSLVMQFDEVLLRAQPDSLFELYEALLVDYLETHIGQQSSMFLTEIIQHLQKIGAVLLLKKILKLVEAKFPHKSKYIEYYK